MVIRTESTEPQKPRGARGRPKGSTSAKPKTEASEPKVKKQNLSDEEEQKLLLIHKKSIDEIDKKLASLTGDRRALVKKAKTDGITMADIKHAQALEKRPDETLAKSKREAQIAAFMNMPQHVGRYDDEDRTPGVDKWFEEGKMAGILGQDPRPPSHLAGVHAQRFMEGWHIGQSSLASGIKPLETEEAPVVDGAPLEGAADADDGDETASDGEDAEDSEGEENDDRDLRPDHLRNKATDDEETAEIVHH